MKEDDLRGRIQEVLSHFNTTPSRVAGDDAALQNRLSRQLRGASVSYDTISIILDKFPDVSSEWLIRGFGSMLLSDNLPTISGKESEVELELHAEVARLTAENEELRTRCIKLEGQKEYLEAKCDELMRGEPTSYKKHIS